MADVSQIQAVIVGKYLLFAGTGSRQLNWWNQKTKWWTQNTTRSGIVQLVQLKGPHGIVLVICGEEDDTLALRYANGELSTL